MQSTLLVQSELKVPSAKCEQMNNQTGMWPSLAAFEVKSYVSFKLILSSQINFKSYISSLVIALILLKFKATGESCLSLV